MDEANDRLKPKTTPVQGFQRTSCKISNINVSRKAEMWAHADKKVDEKNRRHRKESVQKQGRVL